ncbi:MAG TPA: site-specific integrase [Oligoflexia bacterium]|nr:site-specific integrase [Oligoflexia bacterium]HMR24689.1 site-specific integrase [Oligoflexia bacterium]
MKTKKKEVAVKGSPNIYKTLYWSEKKSTWVDPKSIRSLRALPFRAVKRLNVNGTSKKFQKKFKTIEEARHWLRQLTETDAIRKKPSELLTFEELVKDWRDYTKPPRLALSTYQSYEKDIQHLKYFSKTKVTDINGEKVTEWLRYVQSDEYPKSELRFTFKRELKVLHTILNWYRETKNDSYVVPITGKHRKNAKFIRRRENEIKHLSQKEAEAALLELKAQSNKIYFYMASLQLFLGLRIGEVCGLDWSCIDDDGQEVRVTVKQTCAWDSKTKHPQLVHNTKNNRIRTLVAPERLANILRELKSKSLGTGLVFQKKGLMYKYNAIQRAYKRAFKAVGVEQLSTHVFRHTFATIFTEQSQDIRATQHYLGHHDLKVTQRYAHYTESVSRKANKLFGFGKEPTQTSE